MDVEVSDNCTWYQCISMISFSVAEDSKQISGLPVKSGRKKTFHSNENKVANSTQIRLPTAAIENILWQYNVEGTDMI
jgi:hypothetical protein